MILDTTNKVFDRVNGVKNGLQPLVSVIVPTCRHPEILKKAVKSILMQTYHNFEIIVVNDGSYDIYLIIESFGDNRIRLLQHKTQKGPGAARNTGIKEAKGKYIAFLDDDDIYHPEHLEILVSVLERTSYKVAYTDAYRVRQTCNNKVWCDERIDIPYSCDFNRDKLLVCNYIPILTLMLDRELLCDNGFFDEKIDIMEDWKLLIRLSGKVDFYHIPKVTCRFYSRIGDESHYNIRLSSLLKTYLLIYDKYPAPNDQVLQERIDWLRYLKNLALRCTANKERFKSNRNS